LQDFRHEALLKARVLAAVQHQPQLVCIVARQYRERDARHAAAAKADVVAVREGR